MLFTASLCWAYAHAVKAAKMPAMLSAATIVGVVDRGLVYGAPPGATGLFSSSRRDLCVFETD